MTTPDWDVELSAAAERDFAEIVGWTARQFGRDQAAVYRDVLKDPLDALAAGPDIIGVRLSEPRDDRVIKVVRFLHGAMDPLRHIPDDDG